MNAPENIELVYDSYCPLCKAYCQNIRPVPSINLTLVDARDNSGLMREVSSRGYDIDQGMVLKAGGAIYEGSAAIRELARRSQRKGFTGWANHHFFNTQFRADIFYPLAKYVRNIVLRILGVEDIHNLKPENTLKSQLGQNWEKLHPNICARFDKEPQHGEFILYEGTMQIMRRSFMGWLFATLSSVIGHPLSPYQGQDVPVEVMLFKKPGRQGVFWQRTYFIPDRRPYIVTSAKQQSKKGELLECVGGGFGMKLSAYAENESLHFKSYRYFFTVLKYRVPLPHWITPGQTHVIHKDLGEGRFSFTISMRHFMLGETFYQHGIFSRRPD